MNYSVIIEKRDGLFRAVIPALSNLTAEGPTRKDAIDKAQCAAENYLAGVEVVSIEVGNGPGPLRPDSPQAWLRAAGKFVGDEVAMLQHIEEIYAERRKQRELAENDSNGE